MLAAQSRRGTLSSPRTSVEAGLPAAPGHEAVIAVDAFLLGHRDRRARLQQAIDQEHLEEAQLALVDADGVPGADVQGPQLDVLHAAAPERRRGPLAGLRDALRPDGAVELVLDLQLVGIQLPVLASRPSRRCARTRAAARAWPGRGPARTPRRCWPTPPGWPGHCCGSRGRSCAARWQRARRACRASSSSRLVGPRPRTKLLHRPVRRRTGTAAASRAGARCAPRPGRSPSGRPAGPRPVLALQLLVQGPEGVWQRVVVMNAGDGLHDPPVAVAEAAAVDGLHPADVGRPVLGERHVGVAADGAGHAERPEQFVADALHDELMHVAEELDRLPVGQLRRA